MDTISFWFRRKYNLPPNDPRFLDLTLEQIEAEYWAWHYFEQPPGEEFDDEDFDEEEIMAGIEARALARQKQQQQQQAQPAAESEPSLDDINDWEDIGTKA